MVELIASSRFSGVVGSLSPSDRYCFGTILVPSASTPRQIGRDIGAHLPSPRTTFLENCPAGKFLIENSPPPGRIDKAAEVRSLGILEQPSRREGERVIIPIALLLIMWLIIHLAEFFFRKERANNERNVTGFELLPTYICHLAVLC